MAATSRRVAKRPKAKPLQTKKPVAINQPAPVAPAAAPARPAKLPSAWRITGRAAAVLRGNWKLFAGVTVVYTLLNLLLVRGLSGIGDRATLQAVLDSDLGTIAGGIGNFALLLQSSGSYATPVGGLYQTLLVLVVSLALVWMLRQVLAGTARLRVRDAFYRGMYPLIPVLLVLLVICLQLLPLIFGAGLYSSVIVNGIATQPLEYALWGLLSFLLALASLYLLTSSIFGLYIAALPDMTPIKALRSARGLVRGRRWTVMRKVLFLPFMLFVVSAAIMLPIIILLTAAAPLLFFLLTMLLLPWIHAYLYMLYRELLV